MQRERFSPNNLPNLMRRRFDDSQRFLMLCICAGVLCGLVGVNFHLAITSIFEALFAFYKGLGLLAIPAMILSPAFASLIVGLMIRYISPILFQRNFGQSQFTMPYFYKTASA